MPTAAAVSEAVEILELGARWWLPFREDAERATNAVLARIDELRSDVKEHGPPSFLR
jgi:hypothetical protein